MLDTLIDNRLIIYNQMSDMITNLHTQNTNSTALIDSAKYESQELHHKRLRRDQIRVSIYCLN